MSTSPHNEAHCYLLMEIAKCIFLPLPGQNINGENEGGPHYVNQTDVYAFNACHI